MTKIAINGFGRIGRLTLRNLLQDNNDLEVVAVNDLADNAMLAHLFKYDSAQGMYAGEVSSSDDALFIDGKRIHAYTQRNPEELPWKELGVDIVLECTGIFTNREKASLHLNAGADRVIISAPAKSPDIPTVVLGVNDEKITASETIFSNASCTTNCLAPVVKIIDENFGFRKGHCTTTHAYTSTQNIQDAPHKDMRRARAAAFNIVPTSTGAANAVVKVYPAVNGKLDAIAFRVPIITGSIIELNCLIEKETTTDEVNAAFKQQAEGKLKGILEYATAPLVSSDIVGNPNSSIFDSQLTDVNGDWLRVVSWYDNEAGYAARLADMAKAVAKL